MRSTEEQMKEILKRRQTLTGIRSIRSHICTAALCSFACLAVLAASAFYIPRIDPNGVGSLTPGIYGSLLLSGPFWGYALVGTASFALGISFTMLCLNCKALKSAEERSR